MGLVLLVLVHGAFAGALRLAAGAVGRRVAVRWAVALALLPLPFVGGGFLPGKVLAPTNGLAGNPPWCDTGFLSAARDRSTDPNPLLFDPLSQGEPWRRASRDDLLFNPAAGSGAALLGNAQSAPFFPPELLGRLLPPTRAASWIQAARLLVAAFGMFLLARTFAFREAPAFLAAAAFVSAGFLQLWRAHALASVAALTPWILASVLGLLRRPSRRRAVAVAVVGAVAVSAGHPETLLQSAGLTLFAVLPVLLTAFREPGKRRRAVRAVAWGAGAATLAALLAAPALLPFLETMRASASWHIREMGFLPPVEEPARQAADRLALAVQLLARGDPIRGNFRGPSNLVEAGGAAAGSATLVLAVAGLAVGARRRFAVSWLALGTIGLLVSVHVPYVARLALLVPWLGHSILDRLSLWWVVAVSLLAGLGLDAIRRRQGRALALAAAAALALALAFLAAALPTARLPMALGMELAGLALAGAAAGGWSWLPESSRLGILALAVVVPRAAFFATWVPVSSAATFYPETPAIRHVRSRAEGFRVAGVGTGLWPASAAFFGLEDPRSYDPLTFADYARLEGWIGRSRVAAWPVVEDPGAPSLRFLGVRYVFDGPAAPPRPPLVEVYRGSDATVFESPGALPRAFLPKRVLAFASAPLAAEATKRIADPAVDAVLTTTAVPEGTVLPNGAATLRDLVVGRRRVEFRVSAGALVLVATSQPAIPGWKVEVDGREAQPARVNAAFLGVVLPAGEHRVTMRYAPASFAAGLALFAVGVLVAAAAAAWPGSLPAPGPPAPTAARAPRSSAARASRSPRSGAS